MATLIQQRTGFLPGQQGFHFSNNFPEVPVFKLLGRRVWPYASSGLCGGMIYAALDYYCAGMDIPPAERLFAKNENTILPETEWLLDYLVKRLVSSFNVFDLRNGALNYLRLMQPGFPEAQASDPDRPPRSWAWTMVNVEWPVIRAKLDTGQPVPLGLVYSKFTGRVDLAGIVDALQHNHQVLAYGYDLDGDALTIHVYDPNHHGRDDVTLCLGIADPECPVAAGLMVKDAREKEILCFFHTRYEFIPPPDAQAPCGRLLLFESGDCTGPARNITLRAPDVLGSTTSFVILGGTWSLYRQPGYVDPVMRRSKPLVLGPGEYPCGSVPELEGVDIRSLQVVG